MRGRHPLVALARVSRGMLPVLASLLAAGAATATTHLVTNTGDSGVGSLRQRIQIAAAGDTIAFAPGAIGTVALSSELTIGRDLVIRGPGANLSAITGGNAVRIFNVTAGNVVISDLLLAQGRVTGADGAPGSDGAPGRGGGILNAATLTLERIELSDCHAIGGDANFSHADGGTGGAGEGAGIYSSGTLTMIQSTVEFCVANGGQGLGTVGPGDGGLGRGGGLFNAGTASLTNCTLGFNTATGGASASQRGGDGRGGAIHNAGSLTVTHGTLTTSTATGGAGGSASGDGRGGGVYGGMSARSTIVALNVVAAGAVAGPDGFGTFASQGYNLVGKVDGSAGWVGTDQTGTIAAPLDPFLAARDFQSGSATATRRPLPGSAAIDRGGAGGPNLDQTGHPRVYDDPAVSNAAGGDGSDIGAVEVQPPVCLMVTSLGDPDSGTLRRALMNAAWGDTVCFEPGLSGTVALTHGMILVLRRCVILGPGADVITVNAGGAVTLFYPLSPFQVSGLTLNGVGGGGSACIYGDFNATLTVEACAIVDNGATGIVARNQLTLRRSTIARNTSAVGVGGIQAFMDLYVQNCTISGNSGPNAGGIWASGDGFTRSIVHGTISDNHWTGSVGGAGGVFNQSSTAMILGGTVVAGNTAPALFVTDLYGTIGSQGYNLIGVNPGTFSPTTGDQVGTTSTPLDPMLGPLSDNGGTTETMLPLVGSPLIDHALTFSLTPDQRGVPRPFDAAGVPNVGDGSDVGAVEWLPGPLAAAPHGGLPAFGLVAATPSPFRLGVTLTLSLSVASDLALDLYAVSGARVRSLARGRFASGAHRIAWDGRDDLGRDVPSGVYFARLRGPHGASILRVVRIR